MELAVYNIEGKDTGKKVTLNDEVFGLEEPNNHAIYLDVKQYLANQRQGTHKSKERSEVAGSTKKLGRQKGGGGARRGDINSPLLVGGGRVFGPRPRDYRFKLNKKVKLLARKSALSAKAAEGSIGACSYPAIVFKGMRMAGQMGNERVTVQNLQVIKVIPEHNILMIKGSIPGCKGSIVLIEK